MITNVNPYKILYLITQIPVLHKSKQYQNKHCNSSSLPVPFHFSSCLNLPQLPRIPAGTGLAFALRSIEKFQNTINAFKAIKCPFNFSMIYIISRTTKGNDYRSSVVNAELQSTKIQSYFTVIQHRALKDWGIGYCHSFCQYLNSTTTTLSVKQLPFKILIEALFERTLFAKCLNFSNL